MTLDINRLHDVIEGRVRSRHCGTTTKHVYLLIGRILMERIHGTQPDNCRAVFVSPTWPSSEHAMRIFEQALVEQEISYQRIMRDTLVFLGVEIKFITSSMAQQPGFNTGQRREIIFDDIEPVMNHWPTVDWKCGS